MAIVADVTGRAGRIGLIVALGWSLLTHAVAAGQESDPDAMRVEVEVAGGVHYVGQGLELRVGVVARGQRPEVDPPAIAGADVWLIRNELKPLSVGGIGSVTAESNVFVSRFRVVPRRAGMLEVPSIRARLRDRTGRSRKATIAVRPVPPEGRTSEFLGGVGRFSLQAEATPRAVRVGQDVDYRITVTGPAAWGMTGRPELKRFDRLPTGLRIEPKPVDVINEPPSRTFVYRLRPTRPGEAVLPPVAVSAFDPATSRYFTRVTAGIPIKVIAVPSFDPATIPDLSPIAGSDADRSAVSRWWAGLGSAVLLLGSSVAILWVRRRARMAGQLGGAAAARRFAVRVASGLAAARSSGERPGDEPAAFDLAQQVNAALIRYLQVGTGRPPAALTPDEVREGVEHCTGSEELGVQADRIAARCDGVLFRDAPAQPEDPERFRRDARELFTRLGAA